MNTIIKFLAAVVLLGTAVWALDKWHRVFIQGSMYQNGDLMSNILMGLIPVLVIGATIYGISALVKLTKTIPAILFLAMGVGLLNGCSRAHANMQTLITSDCGVNWTLIKPGQTIPQLVGPCSYSTTIPDYPMQGQMKFRANFKGNVKSNINIGYDYRIVDAMAFIGEAKYIGRQGGSEDTKANDTRFEAAENVVIDKRILDVTSELLLGEDIVDFSPLEFENKLLPEINKRLKPLGIEVQFLALVPDADELTNDAIDAATAVRIYELKGMKTEGLEIMKAKAGATRIVTTNQTTQEKPKE